MKYMITIFQDIRETFYGISTTLDEITVTHFPAIVGNPNYDQFLEQTGLTDAEVHELEPDVWYDLPE